MSVSLSDVTVTFGSRTVIDQANVTFPSGAMSVIMGPSGAGKSTLLAAIAGYVPLTAGLIDLGGISRSRIAFIFQSTHLVPYRTASDNIALGAMARGATYRQASEVANGLLERLSIAHLGPTRVFKLSGGERQRVSILRAVAFESPIVLADEPTASLDPVSRQGVVTALQTAADAGATVIVSTHDPIVADQSAQVFRLWE